MKKTKAKSNVNLIIKAVLMAFISAVFFITGGKAAEAQEETAHVHKFSLVKDFTGEKAIVYCDEPGCNYENGHVCDICFSGITDRPYQYDYDDTPEVIVDGDTPEGFSVPEISYYQIVDGEDQAMTEVPFDEGDYRAEAVISLNGQSVTIKKNFTISLATLHYSIEQYHDEIIYDGEPKSLVLYVGEGVKPGDLKIFYRIGLDGEWTDTRPPKAADAGEYDVYYYIECYRHYKSVGSREKPFGPIKAVIKPAPITVGIKDSFQFDYDEKEHEIKVFVIGNYSSTPTISYRNELDKNSEYVTDVPKFKLPGDYSYSVKVTAPNYESFEKKNIIVRVRYASFPDGESPVDSVEAYDGVYDGNNHHISIKLKNAAQNAVIKYCLTEKGIFTETPIEYRDVTDGYKTVYYRVQIGNNAVYGSSRVRISPRTVTVTPKADQMKVIGTDDPVFKFTAENLIKGDNLSGELSRNPGEELGEYDYTIGTLGENDHNYDVVLATGDDIPKFRIVNDEDYTEDNTEDNTGDSSEEPKSGDTTENKSSEDKGNPDQKQEDDYKIKKNLYVTDKETNGKYKVTKVITDKTTGKVTGGNVTFVCPLEKKNTAIIKSDITIAGIKFKVTAISANAFKNNKKLKKVVIGEEVTTIGKKAFYGCKKLSTVVIKSKKIKKIGAKAFKGISKKARFKATKAIIKNKKLNKKYIRLIKKAGCKITKLQ